MTPERYQRLSQIFQDALEYGPAQRDGFLLEVCGDDAALMAEIKVMLRLHQEQDTFFDHGAVTAGAAWGWFMRRSVPREFPNCLNF